MKSFARLLKNEFIKIYHQTAYRVLIIILVALFVIMPLIMKGTTSLFSMDFLMGSLDDELELYEDLSKSSSIELDRIYYGVTADCIKLFVDKKLSYDSWQYSSMFRSYLESSIKEKLFSLLKSKTFTLEQIMASEFSNHYNDGITEEQYEALHNQYKSEKERFTDLITNAKVGQYYQSNLDTISGYAEIYKQYLEKLNADKVISADEAKLNEIKYYEMIHNGYLNLIRIYKIIVKENAEFNGWKYNSSVSAQTIIANLEGRGRCLTYEEFSLNSELNQIYESYEEYSDAWNKEMLNMSDSVKALAYSVENNIPLQATQSSSSKSMFRNTVISNLDYIMYFSIVLASLIIAGEFTSGTSRLLFIRPHRRVKILMSKYTAVISIVALLNLINIVFTFIMTLMTNGVGDLFKPDLVVKGIEVIENNAFFVFLGTLILANLRVILITTIAFMLASITRKGVLGIVLGILIDMVVSGIASILLVVADVKVAKFIPISYYNMESLVSNNIESCVSQYSGANILASLSSMQYGVSTELSIIGGLANYFVWISACIAVMILVFKKREITN